MTSTAMKEYSQLLKETGLNEVGILLQDGMDCRFCASYEKPIKYILVYEAGNKLYRLIEDESHFALFNRAIYLHDLHVEGVFNEVYIIYIASGHSDNLPVQKIEANKTYARKYVFYTREAITFINGVRMVDTEELSTKDNPLYVWADILGKVGLTGCLSETFFTKNITSYLDGVDFNSETIIEENYELDDDVQFPTIKWVKTLDTTRFRSFCFDNIKLNFGQINLLYGANGSGKSSVLEAIEFALTSEIRRMTDFKVVDSRSQYPIVSVYTRDARVIRCSPQEAKRNAKQIERSWYGVPLSRGKSTLNINFSRFNSFDSEASYNFVHNTDSSSMSFASAFGNLMFGEKVIDSEKKWRRYYAAFQSALVDLEKQIAATEPELIKYKSILEDSSEEGYSKELENNLLKMHYKKIDKLPEEVLMRYKALLKDISLVYEVVRPLEKSPLISEQTFAETRSKISSAKRKNRELVKKQDEIGKTIEQYDLDLRTFEGLRMKISRDISSGSEEYYALLKSEIGWFDMQRILENQSKLDLFDKLYNEKFALERKIEGIKALKDNQLINAFFEKGKFDEISTGQLISTRKKKEILKKELDDLETRFNQRKALLSAHEAEYLEIRKLGKLLAIDSKCPLCGHEYSGHDELLAVIDSSNSSDSEVEQMLSTIVEYRKNIHFLEEILDFNAQREAVISQLREMENVVSDLCELNMNLAEIYQFINSEEQIQKELVAIESRLSTLEKEGYSLNAVYDARNYKLFDSFYQEYNGLAGKKGDYYSWLHTKVDKATKNNEKLQRELEEIDKKKDTIQHNIQLQRLEKEKVDLKINNISLQEYYTIEAALKETERFFALNSDTKVYLWIQELQLLRRKVSAEIERLQNDTTYGKAKTEVVHLSELLKTLYTKKKRAIRAISAFEKMPQLSTFVEESIRENIGRIRKYFKWMHHSGEFTTLDVDSQGIYAVRGMNDQIVRIYEMSTGQRAAMAMSVMLAFHTAAKSVPEFILLDEPLATMDDIQVMNVLDILKSLAKNGTQVFFTTANEEMIRLFKDAFANTDFDYKEYEFIKRINNTSVIHEHSVNSAPTLEELTMDDITLDFNQFNEIRRILARNQEKLSTI